MTYTEPAFTDWLDIIAYSESTSSNLFGIVLLSSIFLLTMLALKNWSTGRAMLAASIITFIAAIPLVALGGVSQIVIAPLVLIIVVSLIFAGDE
jgi:hypothetical protein